MKEGLQHAMVGFGIFWWCELLGLIARVQMTIGG